MKVVRIVFYVFYSLFAAIFLASVIFSALYSPRQKKLDRIFPDKNFPLSHQYYEVDSNRYDYYALGPDTAQRIIFVHGSPGEWSDFSRVLSSPELFTRYRLISLNRIGYGASRDMGGNPDLDAQVDIITPLMDESASGLKPVLVGWSLGGPIVIRAAMRYSEQLCGVVSIAGSFDATIEPFEWYRGLYKVFPLNVCIPATIRSSNDELFTHVLELHRIQDDWKYITCPVYILQGMNDILVSKRNADFAEAMLDHLDQKKIIRIEKEDHFIPWTKVDLVVQTIIEAASTEMGK